MRVSISGAVRVIRDVRGLGICRGLVERYFSFYFKFKHLREFRAIESWTTYYWSPLRTVCRNFQISRKLTPRNSVWVVQNDPDEIS